MRGPVPVIITGHFKRADYIMYQKREYFPYAHVCMDHGLGIDANSKRSLEMLGWYCDRGDCEWGFKIEDDIIPMDGFVENIDRILTIAPDDAGLLSFFSNRTADIEFLEENGPGFYDRSMYKNATFFRTSLIGGAVDHIDNYSHYDDKEDPDGQWDRAVSDFIVNHSGFSQYVFLPSLVEHIGQESVIGHSWEVGGVDRSSPTFPGRDYDLSRCLREAE